MNPFHFHPLDVTLSVLAFIGLMGVVMMAVG